MPRRSCWLSCACASALLVPDLAAAQEAPPAFSYATYFECTPGREARVDAVMRQTFFPIFDRHVAAKRLTGWGWLAHTFGGHWRRAGFMVAPSLDAALDGQAAVLKDMQAQSKAFAELSSICPRHEDYIWRRVISSERGEQTRRRVRWPDWESTSSARRHGSPGLILWLPRPSRRSGTATSSPTSSTHGAGTSML